MSEDRANELKERQEAADKENAGRTGVGTRKRVGQTRGKGSFVIDWEAFDLSKSETLPKSIKQFTEVTKVTKEEDLLSMLIDGYNDAQYAEASDPIGEYVENSWPADVKTQFRLVVRNYAKVTGDSIEDVVKMVKPGIVKKLAAAS